MDQTTTAVSRREFPRIEYAIRIGYELAKWNEIPGDRIAHARYITGTNISASGIGLSEVPDFDRHTVAQLMSGKEKIRLALYLDGHSEPLVLFARLVWINGDTADGVKCGFNFLDISPSNFRAIVDFIEARTNS
jgi:c-di-GMP-binding flagellar brake protein YcgR